MFTSSIVSGLGKTVSVAKDFFVDTETFSGGYNLLTTADYSTGRGWFEGSVGFIGMAAVSADAGMGAGDKAIINAAKKWVPKGGRIMLGRFGKTGRYMSKLKELARKYHARILNKAFPKGISLKQGLRKEIDAAEKIFFRMKGVKPGTISHDIEYKYIKSKHVLKNKTEFLWKE